MDAAQIFQIANAFAFFGWVVLIGFPENKKTLPLVRYGFIGLLSLAYVLLLISRISNLNPMDFGSLQGVKALFTSDEAVTLGWIHYLAFDMLAGTYIVEKAQEKGLSRWLYTLCLPFTFMFGPMGLLLFYLVSLKFRQSKNEQ